MLDQHLTSSVINHKDKSLKYYKEYIEKVREKHGILVTEREFLESNLEDPKEEDEAEEQLL